ncbi:RNA polymerase sigma factor [compost metagenome]
MYPSDIIQDEVVHEMKHSDQIDLERAFEKLKHKHRHVVMLKYYQDMTTAQIAHVLQRPEGTIKSWLREGLKQLRKYMLR